ncbi:MAG: ATP phosphoribosyltransferase [Dichotomicrobium sp.]
MTATTDQAAGEDRLILAIPSKGRLMERSLDIFAEVGLPLARVGHERGYRGVVEGRDDIDVLFLSASEIAHYLGAGRAHMGITGEDLIREQIPAADERVELVSPLGFGQADVVVAVPACWIDVHAMQDIEDMAALFYRTHGRRLRVATKFPALTRRFFASWGVSGYRLVESLGATEGAPAAGTAEMIVDITSTGATLKANHLKILDDGVILKSQANLVVSRMAIWGERSRAACAAVTGLVAPPVSADAACS